MINPTPVRASILRLCREYAPKGWSAPPMDAVDNVLVVFCSVGASLASTRSAKAARAVVDQALCVLTNLPTCLLRVLYGLETLLRACSFSTLVSSLQRLYGLVITDDEEDDAEEDIENPSSDEDDEEEEEEDEEISLPAKRASDSEEESTSETKRAKVDVLLPPGTPPSAPGAADEGVVPGLINEERFALWVDLHQINTEMLPAAREALVQFASIVSGLEEGGFLELYWSALLSFLRHRMGSAGGVYQALKTELVDLASSSEIFDVLAQTGVDMDLVVPHPTPVDAIRQHHRVCRKLLFRD